MTFVGRTSSGKTSLINSLIGEERLRVSAAPTTSIVTEVIGGANTEDQYAIVHNDGQVEQITQEQFYRQLDEPVSTLRRLQHRTRIQLEVEAHILDTPGYDSIYEEHSEVLNNFIPEADYIVFCVMYRSGMLEADKRFLELLHEVFHHDLPPVVLVINRVPAGSGESDRRVKEIQDHVRSLIRMEVNTFLVEEQGEASVPEAVHLWQWLAQEASSDMRMRQWLERAKLVLESIYENLASAAETKRHMVQLDQEQKRMLEEEIHQLRDKQKNIHALVQRRRGELISELQAHVAREESAIADTCSKHIAASNRWTQGSDCSAFIQAHVLPREAALACKRTAELMVDRLEKLNREMEDLANTAIGHYKRSVTLISDKFEKLKTNVMKGVLNEGMKHVAFQFFRQFGGRGGAGAGVANFGKMALKHVGKLFNKTFSRQTHNQVAQILAKLGLTSTKVLGNVVAVLIEIGFYLWDVATWQGKLDKKLRTSLRKWSEEFNPQVAGELDLSIKETMALVDEHFDETCKEHEELLKSSLAGDAGALDGYEQLRNRIEQERQRVAAILS
nr:dynamin family protein [Paenibacillus hamazuiensis]